MVNIKREGVLLEATEFEFENEAVLNPTVFQDGEDVHLFYRAVREGNYSSIGYCRLNGPMDIRERSNKPILYPEFDFEIHGVEDPRIISLEGRFYLFYTGYDGKNARLAYAVSEDLKKWEKKGLITHYI